MAQSEIKRKEWNKKVAKGNDEISKRIWEGILHECQQNQKKERYRRQNITGTKTGIWVLLRTDQFWDYPAFLYGRSALRGKEKVEYLYVRLIPHSATFVLFNDALFFTHGNPMTVIY